MNEADLAEILSKNPDIKLRPEYRLSAPRRVSTGKVATPLASEPSGQSRATAPPKAKPSSDRPTLRKLALAMSESDLQSSIIDLAHLYHWKVAHFRSVQVKKKDGTTFWQTPVAADGEGWPDLVLVRKAQGEGIGRVIFAELKKEREKLRPVQVEWLEILILTKRVEVYTWRPSDWLDGTIEGLLR